jgi:uncharacterized protein (TIGR04255 family)
MVTKRPDDLPDFENPPVVETVLSVQFEGIAKLRTARLGVLWDRFRARFPRTEERPPLDPVFERFNETPRVRLGLQVQSMESFPIPRLWFLTEQENEMIQVQPDRFIKNWRKKGPGEQYPRYETVRASFERDFTLFEQFLADNQLDSARINQCEVTYVNHIVAGEGWQSFEEFDRVFTSWQPVPDAMPGRPEDIRFHCRFVIPGESGQPVGRLHVDVQPAFRKHDDMPMYVLHLTARGQVGESFDFFDLGRLWIVRSFAALTTPQMHRIWRRVG